MKTIALALLLAVPSSGWAQAVSSPAYPQADAPVARSLVPREAVASVEVAAAAPIYKRWYFWTGVGAVVAGIVITSVAVGMASASRPRALSPNELCAGPCDACVGLTCK